MTEYIDGIAEKTAYSLADSVGFRVLKALVHLSTYKT
jgi:hypothetical protein